MASDTSTSPSWVIARRKDAPISRVTSNADSMSATTKQARFTGLDLRYVPFRWMTRGIQHRSSNQCLLGIEYNERVKPQIMGAIKTKKRGPRRNSDARSSIGETTRQQKRDRAKLEEGVDWDEMNAACNKYLAGAGLSNWMRQPWLTRSCPKAEEHKAFVHKRQDPTPCKTLRQAILVSVKAEVVRLRGLGMIHGGAAGLDTTGWEGMVSIDGVGAILAENKKK